MKLFVQITNFLSWLTCFRERMCYNAEMIAWMGIFCAGERAFVKGAHIFSPVVKTIYNYVPRNCAVNP